ncbi:uncharacterized protein LOC127786942 [Diospyros lotus]|uniref:uncharacterized protein LOC127786942 n=1 Tax=Diospyros lotus TaxID=55363 RepID=UPI0022564434|nr:uncharacterized protein LOC127786942 [Diospyros lotus]
MSSPDLFVFDDSFLSDQLSPFADSAAIEILQPSPLQNPANDSIYLPQIPATVFSTSPPSHQLQSLTLSQFPDLAVKTEQVPAPLHLHLPCEFDSLGNVAKMMQRNFGSHSFDSKLDFLLQPYFDGLMESPSFNPYPMSSPETCFSGSQIRRVCSTGDLQATKTSQGNHRPVSSPLSVAAQSSFMEEANSKVGRYSAEERKERIHRYRAKRNQRNFNKTIKYACRKTLADNRPRIRGRFARNDETGEIPKAAPFQRYEDEDELWIGGMNEEDVGGGAMYNNILGPTPQLQYYGY